jgi:hypothetical protein
MGRGHAVEENFDTAQAGCDTPGRHLEAKRIRRTDVCSVDGNDLAGRDADLIAGSGAGDEERGVRAANSAVTSF